MYLFHIHCKRINIRNMANNHSDISNITYFRKNGVQYGIFVTITLEQNCFVIFMSYVDRSIYTSWDLIISIRLYVYCVIYFPLYGLGVARQ